MEGRRPIDPYSSGQPRFVGIVDTDALLSSIDNDCRHNRRSYLLRMTDFDTACLYAADHVYEEVYRKLPKVALSSSASFDRLRMHFEDAYLPRLRFVAVSESLGRDDQVARIVDPADVPTGQLAKLLAPSLVFSADKHLRSPGLAPKRWLEAAQAGANLAEAQSHNVAVGAVFVVPGWGAYKGVRLLSQWTGVSAWLLAGAALAGLAGFLRPPERRNRAMQALGEFAEMLGPMIQKARELESSGSQGLREVILSPPVRPSLPQRVAIVASRQLNPLLAREIAQLVRSEFPEADSQALCDIRTILETETEYVRVGRYRWQFGRYRGPLHVTA
jgi:hypothetical protein